MKDIKWWVCFGLLAAIGCVGAFLVLTQGHGVFGTGQFVTWGLLISSYEFLAASSTGVCIIAAYGFLRGIEPLAGWFKRLLVLAAALLVGGFSVIGLELGQPLHAINMLLSPNFGSAILWMIILYKGYLVLIFGTLFFLCKQEQEKGRRLGLIALVVAVIATANMGALLGFVEARPFWHGLFLPLYFIITALLSGVAFIAAVLYWQEGDASTSLPKLAKLFRVVLIATIIAVLLKVAMALSGVSPGKYESLRALLSGPLSVNFWLFEVVIGLVIPLGLLFTAANRSRMVFLAALMVLVGVFTMRYDLVIAGQIVPIEVVNSVMPPAEWAYHIYSPSFAEWSIVALGFGLAGLAYLLGTTRLPLCNDSKTSITR